MHRLSQARRLFRVVLSYVETPSDAATIVSVVAWVVALPMLKFALPLPALVRLVCFRAPTGRESRARACKIVSLVGCLYQMRLLRREGNCLERSLLAYRFFARAYPGSRLTIGVREVDGHWLGHAWVSVGDRAANEAPVPSDAFCPIVTFDANGVPHPVERQTCPIS